MPRSPVEQKFNSVKKPRRRGSKVGLLVTEELTKAIEECEAKVGRIAKECRMKNRKFRDVEFDLQLDKDCCLRGLVPSEDETYDPSDVRRVTDIFDNPQFFLDNRGAQPSNVVQGGLGDCWFLSALATLSTSDGVIESFCVARDEQVGVYGFIFFRDASWVPIIIDDLLYSKIPKYEELHDDEKVLYHRDKETFNKLARRGSKTLFFASSAVGNETWVPLIEKAYAKLHGDYQSLSGGFAGEAMEDLTGGVTTFLRTKDILDVNRFWREELLHSVRDRIFSAGFENLSTLRSGDSDATIEGLFGGHSYSVLRAVEYKDKKFVIVRNPWGNSEWTGRWSDGSKEWTPEWLDALTALGHVFGNDGQFVMEYQDFLASFEQIDRTLLFDHTWIMSSQWLEVPVRPLPSAWSYGDASFTISLDKPSKTVIALSRLDDRYFQGISGHSYWKMDFLLFKKGDHNHVAHSTSTWFGARSENLEMNLDAGDYVVHVRLDRKYYRPGDYYETNVKDWNQRKLSRVLTERAKGQSIAINFNADPQSANLPIPLDELAGRDLDQIREAAEKEEKEKAEAAEGEAKERAEGAVKEAKEGAEKEGAEVEQKEAKEEAEKEGAEVEQKEAKEGVEKEGAEVAQKEAKEGAAPATKEGRMPSVRIVKKMIITKKTIITTTTEGDTQTVVQETPAAATIVGETKPVPVHEKPGPKAVGPKLATTAVESDDDKSDSDSADDESDDDTASEKSGGDGPSGASQGQGDSSTDANSIFLGLRVYTHKPAVAVVVGQLKDKAVQPPAPAIDTKEPAKTKCGGNI